LSDGNPITLVTGASRGIGRALAEHYAGKGHLVIGCSRSEVDDPVDGCEYRICDVSDETAVRGLFSGIRADFGGLDNLINNAGIAAMNHSLLTPASSVRKILETNVLGGFLATREAAKLMRPNKYGRIVNFSTVAVPLKLEGEAAYVASKAALESLTYVLAREYSAFNITVNAVGPTPIQTDLIKGVGEKKIAALVKRQPIPRLGEFSDVANVTDFFIDPASSFITGQVIYLGGL